MSLKNLAKCVALVTLGALCTPTLAETQSESAGPRSPSAAARSHREERLALSDDAQDKLISEILGIAGSKATQESIPVNNDRQSFDRQKVRNHDSSPALEKTDDAAVKQAKSAKNAVLILVSTQPETSARPASTKPSSQNGKGSMFGRIIRIDLDTNTVDVQFEGRRQTTVGSKFSVEHDYAFSTEYLGKLEVIYLAGGNRAIAKPVDRTDITRMGKGDRVGGRVVPNSKGAAAGGANQSGSDDPSAQGGGSGARARQAPGACPPSSCVKPPVDNMPQPPPDPAVPYAPDVGDAQEEPAPAPDMTQPKQQRDTLATYRSRESVKSTSASTNVIRQNAAAAVAQRPSAPLGVPLRTSGPSYRVPREKWTGVAARSWGALIKPNRNSPATVLLTPQAVKTASAAKYRSKSLWCAVKPKPATPSPTQTAAIPPPARPASILLFESE